MYISYIYIYILYIIIYIYMCVCECVCIHRLYIIHCCRNLGFIDTTHMFDHCGSNMGLLYVDHTFVPTNSITGLARLRQLFVLHVLQEAWALEEEIIQDARGLALSGWELQITEGCSSKRVVYSGIQVELTEVRETTKQWKRDGNTVMMTSCIPVSFVGNCPFNFSSQSDSECPVESYRP